MKTISVLALSAFLSVTVVSAFAPVYAAAPGAMSGKSDWATKGYKQATKQKKAQGTKMPKPKPQ
jgi:hypothetical protein